MTIDPPPPSLMAAFLAGLLSVASPGGMAMMAAYLAAAGVSARQAIGNGAGTDCRHRLMLTALCFIAGFSLVFILSGASATAAGRWFLEHQVAIRKAGAVYIGALGLFIMSSLWSGPDRRQGRSMWSGTRRYLGLFFIGAVVGTGWTYCVDGELGRIFQYAGLPETAVDGITLLLFYVMGLGVPLLLLSWLMHHLVRRVGFSRAMRRSFCTLNALGLIMLSLVLYTDRLGPLTGFLDYAGLGYMIDLDPRG